MRTRAARAVLAASWPLCWLLCGLLALCAAGAAGAHEVRPAFLELRQTGADTWDVRWSVPARGSLRLGLYLRLPEGCADRTPHRASPVATMHMERWSVRCAAGLAGRTVSIDGLAGTMTDVLARVVHRDGATQTARLTPSEPSFAVARQPSALGVASTYLRLGVNHILFGVDHLLFVLALLILVQEGQERGRGWIKYTPVPRLIETISAFTVAHSFTLAAATLGWIHVPPPPVEAVIALSIVFLACEIVHTHQGRPGLAQRRPWIVAFTFGLLHGLGFAGALAQVGLPAHAIPLALLFFNVGVEVGQLLFVAAALAAMAVLARVPLARRDWAWRVPAYGIGGVAAYWVIQRVASFWS